MPGTAKSIIEVEGKGVRQTLSVAATDWKTLNANLRNLGFTED